MCSRSNWDLELLVFKERGKPDHPEKNLSEQGREPTTNSTHMWRCGNFFGGDVCWNIRNVKLKFFSFVKRVYISLCLSPQFAFCFFLSWDGQKTRVSTIDNYLLLTIQGPLWLSLNRAEIKYSCFAVFFLFFSRGEPVPWRNCTTVPHSCSLTSVRSTTTFFVGTEITLNLSNGQNWLRINVRRTVLILIRY